MVRSNLLTLMKDETTESINADIRELKLVVEKLFDHGTKLGGFRFGTSFLSCVASVSAIYLLILDQTNWRTNMLTSLLVPYIFFTLPRSLFYFLRGQFGLWIAFMQGHGISNTIGILMLLIYPLWKLVIRFV